jgi:ATP-dependent exoDNAse (exonuclease V) beta subunit
LRDGEPVLGVVAGDTVSACAEMVAVEIDRLLRTATVRDPNGSRPIRPEDIAILFRARADHQFFEQSLEKRGIRTYVYKGLGFFDAPEVQDLQALIRYLAEPESNLRAAEFLRSRFVRLSDDGLVKLAPELADAIRSTTFDVAAANLDDVDAPLFERVRASAARWLALADRVPPAELIDHVITDSAYAWELRGRRLTQARENIKKVRTLVRRVQNRGYTTLRRLADYFETLRAGDESNAMIEAAGAVNLMTIHAAKGLEFPVVFLVNMHQLARGSGSGIQVIVDGPGGVPDVVIGGGGSEGTALETARDDEELRRLMYVAVTRARDRLYLGAALNNGKLESRRSTLAGLLPQALRGAFLRAAVGDLGVDGEVDWTSSGGQAFGFRVCGVVSEGDEQGSRTEVPADTVPVDVAALVATDLARVAATSVAAPENDEPATRERRAGRSPGAERLAGTLVHRLFQRRIGAQTAGDIADIARQLIQPEEWAEAGDAVDLAQAASDAASMFLHMRDRPDVAELLGSSDCYYEVPFSCRLPGATTLPDAPGAIVRGSIDCLALASDGRVVIVEFKTGQRRPAHAAQVAVYQKAMQAVWPDRIVETLVVYPAALT